MALCRGFAPGLVYGKKRQQRHAQRCGALPEFDGYCVAHLKAGGYARCDTCRAWRKPSSIASGFACEMCDAGASRRPALPMVGTAVEEGIIDWSRDKELDPPLDSRALGDEALRRSSGPPAPATAVCPWCESDKNTTLRNAERHVYECSACAREFQVPF